jgi:transcriptional regulator GlxA family with amidase domain
MLFGDEIVEVVTQALAGPFPIRHPSQRRGSQYRAASRVDTPLSSGIDPRIREVMRVIDADLTASVAVADLAARVAWSASSLSHRFHAELGLSISAYRTERRLQYAALRLATTYQPIRQIAYGVGYRSLSLADFRQDFRERFDMSAREYRARFWRGPTRSQ